MLTDCKVLVQDLKVCLKGEGRAGSPMPVSRCVSPLVAPQLVSGLFEYTVVRRNLQNTVMTHSGSFSELIVCLHFGHALDE